MVKKAILPLIAVLIALAIFSSFLLVEVVRLKESVWFEELDSEQVKS